MVDPLAELRGDPLSSCSLALGMPAVNAHGSSFINLDKIMCMLFALKPQHPGKIRWHLCALYIQQSTTLALVAHLDSAGVLCSTWTRVFTQALAAACDAIGTCRPIAIVIRIPAGAAISVTPPHTCRHPANHRKCTHSAHGKLRACNQKT